MRLERPGDRGGRRRHRRPRRGDGAGAAPRAGRRLRAGAGAGRGRRRDPGRAERRRRARGARPARRRRGVARACRRRSSSPTSAAAAPVAPRAARAGDRGAATAGPTGSSTAPTCSTCSRAGADEAGVGARLGARSRRWSPTARACACGLADGGGATPTSSWPPTGSRSPLRAAQLDSAPPRFTGHVAWRGAGAGRAGAGRARAGRSARVTMGPGGTSSAIRCAAARSSTSSRSRSARPGPRRAGSTPDDPANLRAAFAGWGGAAAALIAAVEHCWLWGLFDHAPLAALGRRPAGAARRRLPSDAAVPRAGRDDGARGRLGARRLPRPRRRPARAGSPPTRRRGCARATRVQRAAARAGRLYHLRSGPARRRSRRRSAPSRQLAPRLLAARFDWLFGDDVTRAWVDTARLGAMLATQRAAEATAAMFEPGFSHLVPAGHHDRPRARRRQRGGDRPRRRGAAGRAAPQGDPHRHRRGDG